MLNLEINIEGQSYYDLENALQEITRLVKEENRSSANSNDTGSYDYQITGKEETIPIEELEFDDDY